MFGALLAALLVAASVHLWFLKDRTVQRIGETILVYILAGYCGIPMIIVGAGAFMGVDLRGGVPVEIAAANATVQFLGMMLLAMGASATAALYYRGPYLIGPAITWIIYFIGATAIHLGSESQALNMGHGNMLMLLATHGLISVILGVALAMSGVWRKGPSRLAGALV